MIGELANLLEAPADFGDWRAEYAALVESCVLVARADRSVVRVEGERGAEMLNGLLTNQLADLEGSGRHAMLLTPRGRVLTDMRVLPYADCLLLDVPRSGLGNLLDAFRKYLPPLYARFEDASSELLQLGVYGPAAAAAASAVLDGKLPAGHLSVKETEVDGEPLLMIRDHRFAGDGLEIIAPHDRAVQLGERLLRAVSESGGRTAGSRALEVGRVEWGIPSYGIDIDESNFVQETGLEELAVSYDKGCYLGQEVVARVHFRGHVNRLLRSLKFLDALPATGAQLVVGEKDVGVVTSSVESPEFGPIGLGYVRREIEAPAELLWKAAESEGPVTVLEGPLGRRPV
ncbi:MAG: hypothetical protein AMS21_02770 [Gemmatimonas sp. SG8_38_2]|nr:MAG: hypothetical protein AMS21_02770 [Gemmatimonas sp. SG8_38_2]